MCEVDTERPHLQEGRNHRGLLKLPKVEDQHGTVATGHLRLLESSAVDPSMWVTMVRYPEAPCGEHPGVPEERELRLHMRAWQARRFAAQLTLMAEHVDPGGTDEPDPDDEVEDEQ